MAMPDIPGKIAANFETMEIGDCIKCVYEAHTNNTAGWFSQLGVSNPQKKIITITNGGTPVETYEDYTELPTSSVEIPSGHFYLIKVDLGYLIADRNVQKSISWESINKKNYIYGAKITDCFNRQTVETRNITTVTETGLTIAPTVSDTYTFKDFTGSYQSTNTWTRGTVIDANDKTSDENTVIRTRIQVISETVTNPGPEDTNGNPTTITTYNKITTTTVTTIEYAKLKEENNISNIRKSILSRIISRQDYRSYMMVESDRFDNSDLNIDTIDNRWNTEIPKDIYYFSDGERYNSNVYIKSLSLQDNIDNRNHHILIKTITDSNSNISTVSSAYYHAKGTPTIKNNSTYFSYLSWENWGSHYKYLYATSLYRPSFEYVDNNNSTNLYY